MGPPTYRRPVIGLLLNSLFDGYEVAVWKGAIRAAEELDVDLLCFLGGSLGDGSGRSSLFELVQPESVDAVVVLTASVGVVAGPAEVAVVIARMPLPAVSLSEPLDSIPGVPGVLADNAAGIFQAVEHLVVHHGRRRIAYVGGPPSSSEASLRYAGYQRALARHGIALDPALVLDGDWGPSSGLQAVRTLAQRRVSFDALLCSNDLMALAALDELRRSGVDVPRQVAVCGFDDISDAASSSPPLTTVRQPLAEMGREGVRRALAAVRGGDAGTTVCFPAELVVRRTCGCPPFSAEISRCAEPVGSTDAPVSLAARLEGAFPGFGARLGLPTWASELAAALSATATTGEAAFLEVLGTLLSRAADADALSDPAEWFRVLRLAISCGRGHGPEEEPRWSALSEAAHELIGAASSAAHLNRRGRAEDETRLLHRLIQPFPLPEQALFEALPHTLDLLGVRSFFLSRYRSDDLREATLLVHHDLDGVATLEDGGAAAFPARRLIPGRFSGRRRRAHAVLPVQSPDGPIGFAVCEIGPMMGAGYEVLMHQISTVMSMDGLIARVRDQQRQYLEAARQAGMAEMAVGTLHNVGNLLNTVSVCAEQIAALVDPGTAEGLRRAVQLLSAHRDDLPGFFGRDARASLLPEYLERVSEQLSGQQRRVGQEAALLLERVKVIRNTIRGLQDIAREGESRLLREQIDLRGLVATVLQNHAPSLAQHGIALQQEEDGTRPVVVSDRAKLIHVLVNLVNNAVEAMRGSERERILRLGLAAVGEDRVRIIVADTGEGIPPENLEKVFAFGFTTKPDGHGFGLHTCALYAHQLGGSLQVSSPGPGLGATFALELPRGHAPAASTGRAA